MSTYSWPDSPMSAYMISSVIERSDEPVALHALVAGEVERLAEADADPGDARDDLAGRLALVGADHRDRDHRHLGLQRHPGDAGLAAVEPAVGRAGALGVDAEQLALAEHPQAGVQRGLAGPAAGAVDRHLPDAEKNPA